MLFSFASATLTGIRTGGDQPIAVSSRGWDRVSWDRMRVFFGLDGDMGVIFPLPPMWVLVKGTEWKENSTARLIVPTQRERGIRWELQWKHVEGGAN